VKDVMVDKSVTIIEIKSSHTISVTRWKGSVQEFSVSNQEYPKKRNANMDINIGHLKPFHSKKEHIVVGVEQF
jgi:hypothetical protein